MFEKINKRINEYKDYAPVLLRVGLALVVLWFGLSQITNPGQWVIFLPSWLSNAAFPGSIVLMNGIFEVFLGVLLIAGFYTRTSSLLLGIHLLGISYTVGFNATGVRDFGLALGLLAVFLNGADRMSVDSKNKVRSSKVKVFSLVLILIIVLGLAFTIKGDTTSAGLANTGPPALSGNSSFGNAPPGDFLLSQSEISNHNSRNDCWLIINSKVYDVTNFIPYHPGGDRILEYCGKDATSTFTSIHSQVAFSLLPSYYVGDVGQSVSSKSVQAPPENNLTAVGNLRGGEDDDEEGFEFDDD